MSLLSRVDPPRNREEASPVEIKCGTIILVAILLCPCLLPANADDALSCE